MTRKVPIFITHKGYQYVRIPKSQLKGAKAQITIDPDIHFGTPCLAGTRIPADAVGNRLWAGESLSSVCGDYHITIDQAQAALEYYMPTEVLLICLLHGAGSPLVYRPAEIEEGSKREGGMIRGNLLR